jgi:hypothetical protein
MGTHSLILMITLAAGETPGRGEMIDASIGLDAGY